MKYKVHRLNVDRHNMQDKIDKFINGLSGEVVSIIPHVYTLFLFYGSRTDYVLITEKIK